MIYDICNHFYLCLIIKDKTCCTGVVFMLLCIPKSGFFIYLMHIIKIKKCLYFATLFFI